MANEDVVEKPAPLLEKLQQVLPIALKRLQERSKVEGIVELELLNTTVTPDERRQIDEYVVIELYGLQGGVFAVEEAFYIREVYDISSTEAGHARLERSREEIEL